MPVIPANEVEGKGCALCGADATHIYGDMYVCCQCHQKPSMPKMDELRKLIKEFFADDIMRWVNSDHHKQQDGTLEVTYSYYYDNYYQDIVGGWYRAWTVCHPGYVRGDIEGRGKTLEEAIANFRKDWEEKKEGWEDGLEEFHRDTELF